MNRFLLNVSRLGASFGFSIATLWAFGLLGADLLAAFLLFQGLRWTLAIPALGIESAAVAPMGQGVGRALRPWVFATSAGVAGLALGLQQFLSGNGAAIGTAAGLAILQTVAAPAISGLLLARRGLFVSIALVVRRAGDLVALGVAVSLAQDRAGILPVFYAVIIALGLVVTSLTWIVHRRRPVARQAMSQGRVAMPVIAGIAIAASQVIALRLPVLIAAAFLPPQIALPGSIVFVIGAYVRQVFSALLFGLDAEAFHAGSGAVFLRGLGVTRRNILLSLGGVLIVIAAMIPVFAAWPGHREPNASVHALMLALVLMGVVLRVLSDLCFKVLSGLGQQDRVLWLVTAHAVAGLGLYIVSCWVVPAEQAVLAMALIFVFGQGVLALALLRRCMGDGPSCAAPSSPAG